MQLARRQRRAGFMGLTPLIDMIFLLLLFFLLGSDFVTYGQSRLAPPRGTGGETSAAPPVVITLSADGALSWNGARVDAAFLRRETAKLTALIDEQMPVVVVAINSNHYEKVVSNIQEIKARKGKIIAVVTQGDTVVRELADYVMEVPKTPETLTPLVTTIPLQLLSYHIAVMLDKNVDQPRNLAKSVTVE